MSVKWKVLLDAVWVFLDDVERNSGGLATVGEVALYFGVSRTTAWRWLKRMQVAEAVRSIYLPDGDGTQRWGVLRGASE